MQEPLRRLSRCRLRKFPRSFNRIAVFLALRVTDKRNNPYFEVLILGMKRMLGWMIVLLLGNVCLLNAADPVDSACVKDLRKLLKDQQEWVKVHVAEYLLWTGNAVDEVYKVYKQEAQDFNDIYKYRIGIWRVLAQASRSKKERAGWIQKVVTVYKDKNAPDRLHAIETLSKLKYVVIKGSAVRELLQMTNADPLQIYSLWNAACGSEAVKKRVQAQLYTLLLQQIRERNAPAVQVIAYVLRSLGTPDVPVWDAVRKEMAVSNVDPRISAGVLTMLWVTAPVARSSMAQAVKGLLFSKKEEKAVLLQLLAGLALKGTATDRNWLLKQYPMISDSQQAGYNADIHAAAAFALLKMH